MTGTQRLEVNVRRLLAQCESLSKDTSNENWRLSKYLQGVEEMLEELRKRPNKPEKDILNNYIRRAECLRRLHDSQKMTNPVEKAIAVQMISSGNSSTNEVISTEIHQKAAAKYHTEVRDQLFKVEKFGDSELKQRKHEKSTSEDIDALLKYHHNMQEKIAEDMLLLTRSLKEQSQLANDIIKKDTDSAGKSIKIADDNFAKLKIESTRLEEHSRRAWKCWLWVIIAVVMIIFINMVLFMKVTRKK